VPTVVTRGPTRSCSRREPAAVATTTICAHACSARGIERANEHRAAADLTPLPEGLTFHSLRHTRVSALFALGYELPVVMAEVGHADPKVTLGIYAHVMRRGSEAKAALRALVRGCRLGRRDDRRPRTPEPLRELGESRDR
jgi:integrase